MDNLITPHSGDYCYCKTVSGKEYLFIKSEANDALTACHTCYELDTRYLHIAGGIVCEDESILELRAATAEETTMIDKVLLAVNKKWNAERKRVTSYPRKAKLNRKLQTLKAEKY